ncbi:hypothetical protein TNCT_691681 [Trichonephila clavata]|uniref:Uncharacterized protein n=1 Tax=Trichonephila clavata TaxID=2740835 RepID=A0A8X6HF21_TRICU|nr:hypothetical protein TNCT_691681 [Trichonephila clavata]
MYDEFQEGDGPRMQIRKSASYDSSSLPSLCANTFCEELADALLQRASSLRNFHPSVIVGREERFIESLIDLARAIRPALPEPEEESDPQQNHVVIVDNECTDVLPKEARDLDQISIVISEDANTTAKAQNFCPAFHKTNSPRAQLPYKLFVSLVTRLRNGHFKDTPEESFKLEHYVEISPPPEISSHITPVRIPKCRRFRGVAWKKGKRKTLWSRMRRRLIKECTGLKPGSRKFEWRCVKKTLGKGWKTKKTTLMRFVDRLFGNLN